MEDHRCFSLASVREETSSLSSSLENKVIRSSGFPDDTVHLAYRQRKRPGIRLVSECFIVELLKIEVELCKALVFQST